MMPEKKIIKTEFVKGDELPDFVRSKLDFFTGIVEVTVTRDSPYTIQFTPLEGTFSDNLAKAIKNNKK